MEKQDLIEIEGRGILPAQRSPRRSRLKLASFVVLCCFTFWTITPRYGTWFPLRTAVPTQDTADHEFDWADLSKTKPYLDYSPCYDGEYQCARLELPMDYWNGTTNATISLAVIRKPAVVPVTHPQYGGTVLLNPGGPGGSGVGLLLNSAKRIRENLDSDDGKYFDLMSFDPRGVSLSTPPIHCFDDPAVYFDWQLRTAEEGLFSSSDAAFGRLWSLASAYSGSCSFLANHQVLDVKQYVTTSSVATDMLEIVERHGEWRDKEAKRLLQMQGGCHSGAHAHVDIPGHLKYKVGEERINYAGYSYGTYLGNTFAAMYPDRINRLLVDGVVDAYDYKKMLWLDNLVDTEQDLGTFYYHCARVGFPTCALANETGETTTEGVRERVERITETLYHNPLPLIGEYPQIISYSDVKNIIFAALYTPIQAFPFVARLLAAVELGEASEFAMSLDTAPAGFSQDARLAISCSDGDDQSWVTKPEFRKHIDKLTKIAPSVGELWATVRLDCIHYRVRPYHRFEGPWHANTSHPILEIGNTADPVTPGRYAKKMAQGFPGSGFLLQDSAGHCSPSTPSKCTEGYVKQYFQTGELPEFGTVCPADEMPFGPTPGEDEVYDSEVIETRERQHEIAQALYFAGGFGNIYAPWFE